MFEHMFAEMNQMLEEIAQQYPHAQGKQKEDLGNKWKILKQMSDGIIEEWLSFEEKMGDIRKKCAGFDSAESLQLSELDGGPFMKGQGYFSLQMYEQAAGQFREATIRHPESPLPLLFLAVCFVHLGETPQAVSCFNLILSQSGNNKLRSICYNALGCIAAMEKRFEKARELFLSAYRLDPTLPEPLANLEACMTNQGAFQFESQLETLL